MKDTSVIDKIITFTDSSGFFKTETVLNVRNTSLLSHIVFN